MRRYSRILSIAVLAVVTVAFMGCDNTPTSVQDFNVQPKLETPPSVGLVLAEGSASFSTQYQGLDRHPQATATGDLSISKASETGDPSQGEQKWTLTYGASIQGVVTESVILQSSAGNRQVRDTVSVTISRFIISSDLENRTAVVADFENRSLSTSGGTTVELDSTNVSDNTSGVASLQVQSSSSGTATITRRTSAPGATRFSFLMLPRSTDFTLTLTFTDSEGGGTTTHSVDVPVQAGSQWVKYGIALDQISSDFNPVASRAGGDGPMVSVEMSTDQGVTFNVDELRFTTGDAVVAGVHDFEKTSLEYSFGGVSLGTSPDVAENSDGFTARVIDGSGGGFGYNYNNLKANLSENGILSLRVNAESGDELYIFLQTNNGEGGFVYGEGNTYTLPTNGWQTLEIPVTDFGNNPAAIQNAGLFNVGFEVTQGDDGSPLLIDDIRLVEPAD
ncbi:MAG: hypothetical protein ABEL04_09665 [Salinibacter sp.]|uniref:hypothetical protein n=1 Tax=Salinibacter sp. TaxID=2065818 RepID=UPI0035D504D6